MLLKIKILLYRCFRRVFIWKWLRSHPYILLFKKLFHRTASHDGSIKALSLTLKRCGPSSVADVFHVCVRLVFRIASHLGALCVRSSDCLHVPIRGTSFSLLFQNFPNICFRG